MISDMFESSKFAAHMADALIPLFAVIAGVWTYCTWRKDKRKERARQLKDLLQSYQEFDLEAMLAAYKDNRDESGWVEPTDKEKTRKDIFTFLNYVCYLRESNVISQKEFDVFHWDIVRVMNTDGVKNAMATNYLRQSELPQSRPYHALLKFASKNCNEESRRFYRGLLDGNVERARKERGLGEGMESLIGNSKGIKRGMLFRTHLDVLNGLFNMGYLGHQSGAARLDNGDLVWFPKLDDLADIPKLPARKMWCNVLADNQKKILEYWPEEKNSKQNRDANQLRYVFAMDRKVRNGYQFLGVYRYTTTRCDEGCHQYDLVRDRISPEEIAGVVASVEH